MGTTVIGRIGNVLEQDVKPGKKNIVYFSNFKKVFECHISTFSRALNDG
jgi:hypothetical protein